jgi:hypothetical protein
MPFLGWLSLNKFLNLKAKYENEHLTPSPFREVGGTTPPNDKRWQCFNWHAGLSAMAVDGAEKSWPVV